MRGVKSNGKILEHSHAETGVLAKDEYKRQKFLPAHNPLGFQLQIKAADDK